MSALKIGIQGVKASFHDVAARKFFPDRALQPIECPSFKRLSESLQSGEADLCMMAIENSIAGSILTNYSLLESYGFKIIGEVYLRIEMCLLALPGQSVSELSLVQSHPMALLQCSDFLLAHPGLKVLEATDTAESAKLIADKKLVGQAAIASALAGAEYGLEVLAQGIESNKLNYTRFLVICRSEDSRENAAANKSSIRFETAHRPGSLARVLESFSRNSVNMTKIQSVPLLGRPYEYSFHVDLDWEKPNQVKDALDGAASHVINLLHFGDYPRGERPNL